MIFSLFSLVILAYNVPVAFCHHGKDGLVKKKKKKKRERERKEKKERERKKKMALYNELGSVPSSLAFWNSLRGWVLTLPLMFG